MTTQIVPFNKTTVVPAHIQAFVDENSNIDAKINVPQLSFRGKVWRTVIDGEETPLMNAEDEPVSTVHVVVLDHNKARSRSYYEGAYEEGKAQAPACWSSDGDHPDASVKQPQGKSCASCPQSVKGSKITPQGKEVTACSVFKRIAIVPLSNLGTEHTVALLLRLAQTSMWDKNNEENEAKGYYAWDQYLDELRKRGATHTGVVATKIRFDSRVAYPKLLFAASRWLVDEELAIIKPLVKDAAVQALLKAPETSLAARSEKPKDDDDDGDPMPAVKAKAKAAPVEEVYDDEPPPPPKKAKAAPVEDEEEAPAPVVKKKKAVPVEDEEEAPAPVVKKKKAAPVEEEEEAPAPVVKKKKAAPVEEEEAPAPAAKKKPGNGLDNLVEEWVD